MNDELVAVQKMIAQLQDTAEIILSEVQLLKKDVAVFKAKAAEEQVNVIVEENKDDVLLCEITDSYRENFPSFSTRTYNIFRRAGIKTYKDVLVFGKDRLKGTRNAGARTVEEVESLFKDYFGCELTDEGMKVPQVIEGDTVACVTSGELYTVSRIEYGIGLPLYVCSPFGGDPKERRVLSVSQVKKIA